MQEYYVIMTTFGRII